ncbi:hypothetical protein Hdeb2414_s0003g00092901 [Helianthus debilis subsp. tardiflorus]
MDIWEDRTYHEVTFSNLKTTPTVFNIWRSTRYYKIGPESHCIDFHSLLEFNLWLRSDTLSSDINKS